MNTSLSDSYAAVISDLKGDIFPVGDAQLQAIRTDIEQRTQDALSLACNEDSVKEVKKIRSELNKEFREWEDKRKAAKKAFMTPYEQFEAVYKENISDIYRDADTRLGRNIVEVESAIKHEKESEIKAYFDEYVESKRREGIHFPDEIGFDRAGITVTLSASMKSLKEEAKAFVEKVCNAIYTIDHLQYKEEVLYEYTKCLILSNAISIVANRHEAISKAEDKPQTKKEDPPKDNPLCKVTVTITCKKSQLQELKRFLIEGGYKWN